MVLVRGANDELVHYAAGRFHVFPVLGLLRTERSLGSEVLNRAVDTSIIIEKRLLGRLCEDGLEEGRDADHEGRGGG